VFEGSPALTFNTATNLLNINGNIIVSGDITTFSDPRLKENVTPIENALKKSVLLQA
jgi:NADPH-dependent curcumin reductase CurA